MTQIAPDYRAGISAQSSRLCDEIDAEPGAGLLIDIIGPGGCGKTPLIEAAARHYAVAGVPVIRDCHASGDLTGASVLIDDAHLLDEAGLGRLRQLARSPGQRLLVAHRRWPASPALSALGSVLTAHRPPIVLGHLDRAALAERVCELLGAPCPEPLTRLLFEQTAGLPVLLEQLVVGLRDSGQLSTEILSHLAPRTRLDVPAGIQEQLRYVIEALPAQVQEVLFTATLGAGGDTETLTQLLNADEPAINAALHEAQATGLMADDGAVVPLVGRLLLRLAPAAHTNRVCEMLAGLQLRRGGSMLAVGQALMRAGAQGPQIATALLAAGSETLGSAPELADRLFTAAGAAGMQTPSLLVCRADAAARSGRLDEALRLADETLSDETLSDEAQRDEVLSDEHAAERARALGITAAVLAHRGLLSRAAELYRATGPAGGADYPMIAVPVLAGIGAIGEARQVLAAAGRQGESAPTLLSGVESLMAHGIEETISGSPVTALSQLTRAATLLESAGSAPLLPDTPAALAALVAMHAGEFGAAHSVLRRAISAGLGGKAAAARHTLLLAFLATVRGHTRDAHALLASAGVDRLPLEPRDELFAAAATLGLARREGDLAALRLGWSRACEALLRHPVDLYVLLPLGELAVAAARLEEQWWIEPHLQQAEVLLAGLGQPVLWRVPLHWYGMHAAIAGESPEEARRHVSALAELAAAGPYAAVLAGAAACWLRVLAGTADVDAVVATARQLAAAGSDAEGARLAGQAAIRATDRKAMTTLLECARLLRPDSSAQAGPPAPVPAQEPAFPGGEPPPQTEVSPRPGASPQPAGSQQTSVPPAATLSAREQEIARRVLTGLTYKEIGAQLFISAKTVEHHVARIRRRLGATSRRELFGHLQVMLTPENRPD
jgi:DNA-binding CsgD family transcriptional regulator